jgi:hypothetical protein
VVQSTTADIIANETSDATMRWDEELVDVPDSLML